MLKLSVHLLTYNSEKFISECLDSILEQKTTFLFDIVIGDDASTDKTVDIINTYTNIHDNIKLKVQNSNLGVLNNFIDTLHRCNASISCAKSEVIESRSTLEKRLKFLADQYKNQPIPRPIHWGGYVVSPYSIEFWQGRTNRLHDRLVYKQKSSNWVIERLSP